MTRKSFTLIEVLVVVSILTVLAFVLIPNLKNGQYRARDARRKADLLEIQKALELYKLDQNPPAYPTAFPSPGEIFSSTGGNEYLKKIPADPNSEPYNYYYYQRDSTNSLKYTLCSCLENKFDADKNLTNCDASYTCSAEAAYSVKEP